MTKINLHNYEAFLLDYIEGNLSEAEVAELKAFAVLHPELNIDFDPQLFSVVKDGIDFSGKENLKKNEDEFLLNNRALLYVEGLLSASDKTNFEKEIKNNEALRKEVLLLEKIKISTDTSIVYPNKEELKKETVVIFLFSARIWLAAASVALLIGLSLLFINKNSVTKTKKEYSQNKNSPAKEEEKKNVAGQKFQKEKQSPVLAEKNHSTKKSPTIKNNMEKMDTLKHEEERQIVKQNIQEQEKNNLTTFEAKHDSILLAEINSSKILAEETNKRIITDTFMLPVEEDDEVTIMENQEKGFWKRAIKFAKQMNGLGMKSLNGEEKQNHNFILSFNSFSVEKK